MHRWFILLGVPAGLVAMLGCSSEGEPSWSWDGTDGGGGSGGGDGGSTTPEGCEVITPVGTWRYSGVANSGWFTPAYGTSFEPSIGDGWQSLNMKIKDGPGTYDLSAGPINTGDCTHCVYVSYAGSGDHFQLDFAISGTLELEEADLGTGQIRGKLKDVTFRHLEEVGLHSFDGFHDDGHCTYVSESAFSTYAEPGESCLEAGDCPNAELQVCDPRTAQCVEAQCTEEAQACGVDDVCAIQDPFFGVGACFASCVPFTAQACPDGQDCVPVDYVGERGVCKKQGPEAPEPKTKPSTGRSCEPWQIATGCGPGHVCATHAVYWHYDHCYKQCDYFGADPGCDVGRCWLKFHTKKEIEVAYLCGAGDCHFGGICAETDNQVGFGMPCESGQEEGAGCYGSAVRSGQCVPDSSGGLVCKRICRLAHDDCDAGETCEPLVVKGDNEDRAIDGVGTCRN